ncbi:multidrug and toxin extrusion protein 2-like [Xenopus laevis]|uniref:Multidrug and toxin extrusion protein n=2 Tax=Xenopus laevis TaxID=8355 RepID=A0A1L8HFX5_XENLA|nr:multidrug and toxin extrusion protein 2-like [Xenopus laevis]OCT94987.1 hypothetical protein XELAEV_18012671mg [Xenopus laevis]
MPWNCTPGGCGKASGRIRKLFQDNVSELKMLLWFSGPLIITNFLDYAPMIVTAVFCGHLGKMELDAIMLANAFAAVTGMSVGMGLCGACDTLLSQLYGGKNLKLIGIVLQRAIVILSLSCFPCWALYINTKNIFVLLGQNPEVARLAELCMLVNIPALPAFCFFQLGLRYLQNQGIIWPQNLISFIALIINAIFNYILLFVLKTGVIGASVAITVGSLFECTVLYLYIWLKKIHVETWPGWTTECLKEWRVFLALGIPNMLMTGIESWAYEIAIILTGLISLAELGAQTILYQMIILIHKIPFALSMAVSIRVGTFLGAGETEQAKKSAKLSFVLTAIPTLVSLCILTGLRKPIASIFTNDKGILSLVIDVIPVCALFHVLDSPATVFIGLARGIGKPEVGAAIFALTYCLITFPIAVPLMFTAKLGMKGFWIGIIAGFVVINIYFIIYFWRANWQHIAEKAQELVGLKSAMKTEGAIFDEEMINTPDNLELKNYAALDSVSSESEQHEEAQSEYPTEQDKRSQKKLIIRRALESLAVVSLLFIGLIIRLTVHSQQ